MYRNYESIAREVSLVALRWETLEFSISDGLQFRWTTYKVPPVRLHAASTVLSELILTLHSAAAASGTIASRLSGITRAVFVVLPYCRLVAPELQKAPCRRHGCVVAQ